MNTLINSSTRFASLNRSLAVCSILAAFGLGGCVGLDESGDEYADDMETVVEDSEALTPTELANSIWLGTLFPSTTVIKEEGRYKKDAVNGGNGKACWSHEKGFFSIGQITGSYWWLFRSTGCNTTTRVASFPGSFGKSGVNPCTEGVMGITCTQPKVGSIVPLYTYPMTWAGSGVMSSSWNQIIAAKQANPTVPVVAIINPCDGPNITPCATSWGASIADYNTGITQLKNAGIKVIGYVRTNYTNQPEATVNSEIDQYSASYPNVSGIFFDEMTNDNVQAHIDYYKRVGERAKGKGTSYITVGNPGADTLVNYVYTMDTMITYENAGVASLAALQGANNWHSSWDRSNFAVLAYGVTTLDSAFLVTARPYAGYTYLTNDVMPNPWDSLPSYFSTMLGGLN